MIVPAKNPSRPSRSRPSWRRGAPRPAVLALLAVAIFLLQTAVASAVLVQLRSGHTLSFQPRRGVHRAVMPFDLAFTNLDYNGGPVMPSNTNYTIYWAPSGAPAYPSGYQSGINRYLEDLSHDSGGHQNVDSVAAQYGDAAGRFASYSSTFGGSFVDKDPYPVNGCAAAAKCLTDAQLQTEIRKFVEAEHLPTGLSTEYFLLTPPGVEDCFEASASECSAGSSAPVYCAYHGVIALGETRIVYSNDPYVSGNSGCDDGNHPNGNASDGALQGGLSHEHDESITDPEPNNAWTDFGGETGEIGDKCGGSPGAAIGETPSHAKYNQVINGHFYWYQEEWSNQGHACLQRLTFAGAPATASFTVAAAGGNQVQLDAAASTAPGGVAHYSWQFNEASGGPSKPIETSSPTLAHTFSTGGSHTVALTVFSSDGTSAGTAKTFTVGQEGPTAAFSVLTASPVAGAPVTFDGSASTPRTGAITRYEWEFGDGSSGEGVASSHTYSRPGTYEVRLGVTDESMFTSYATRVIEVAPAAGSGGGSGGGAPVEVLAARAAILTPVAGPAQLFPAPAALATVVRTRNGIPGTAGVLVQVSGAGLLALAPTRPAKSARHRRVPALVQSVSVHAFTAGIVRLRVRVTGAGARLLVRKHRLRVSLTVTFTTVTGAHATSRQITLTLTQPRRRP